MLGPWLHIRHCHIVEMVVSVGAMEGITIELHVNKINPFVSHNC